MNSLFELLEKILGAEDGVEIAIPEENFNFLMLKILKSKARQENHQLNLIATGPRSKKLIEQLGGEVEAAAAEAKEEEAISASKAKTSRKFKLGRLFWIPLIILIILVALGGVAYWLLYYFPKAEVNLILRPIPLVKEISVAANTGASSVDAEKNVIPGTEKIHEETGEKETAATGTATVGEKAKGIAAFTSTFNQSCSQGARIQETSSGLVFLADSAFSFSSAPESKDVNVTAEKIGSSYNVGSGKNFTVLSGCTVGGLSIAGTNSAAFTGGSLQQVKVASAADRTKLLNELKEELTDKAKTELAGAGDEIVVDEAIKSEVVEQNYSHAVGEQADTVSLTLKMKFTTISYLGADMQGLISEVIGGLVPEGYTLFPGETVVEPLDPVLAAKRLSFKAKVTAQVVHEIDVEKVRMELAARSIPSAQEYLSAIGEITGYELNLYPSNLPQQFQRIPRNTNRITINLVTEQKGQEQEQQQ